jgi:hypothetical protein
LRLDPGALREQVGNGAFAAKDVGRGARDGIVLGDLRETQVAVVEGLHAVVAYPPGGAFLAQERTLIVGEGGLGGVVLCVCG